jgi:hypothetical protein
VPGCTGSYGISHGAPRRATDDNEPDDGEGGIPHAPRVVPGAYTAELEVNGERVSAVPLILVKDPRSPATQAQLVEQFEKSRMIFDDSLEARGALAEIATVRLQLEKIVAGAGAGADEDAIRKAKELSADLERSSRETQASTPPTWNSRAR